MVSAIILAGYNNKREVKRYAKIVAENYGERFIETGYKPLREFRMTVNGTEVSKPVIQFTLENLSDSDFIDDIVIVGHRMLLEQRLGRFISAFNKPCRIVNQNAKIPQQTLERFHIMPRKVKHNSLAGNLIKGYTASAAYQEKNHALFLASDSPLTSKEFIRDFIDMALQYRKQCAIIAPAVLITDEVDRLGRRPIKLVNDTEYHLSEKKDSFGRQGFRLSSILYGNPNLIDINAINPAYSLRKFLYPKVQLQLFRITRNLGYANVYSKYFIKKDLSIKDFEEITSGFFHGRTKIIPMIGEEATYDYDGTDEEYQRITEMLNADSSRPFSNVLSMKKKALPLEEQRRQFPDSSRDRS